MPVRGNFISHVDWGWQPWCNLDKWLLIKNLFSVTFKESRGWYSLFIIFSFKKYFVWSFLYENFQLSNLGKKCVFIYMMVLRRINKYFFSFCFSFSYQRRNFRESIKEGFCAVTKHIHYCICCFNWIKPCKQF